MFQKNVIAIHTKTTLHTKTTPIPEYTIVVSDNNSLPIQENLLYFE